MINYHVDYFRETRFVFSRKRQLKIQGERLKVNLQRRGQLKIQEMAFVLVAIVIFFVMVGLVLVSIRVQNLKESAGDLRVEDANQLVKNLASSPEFSWEDGSCSNCIDLDKAFVLKNRKGYEDFWDLDYLVIEKIYPFEEGECLSRNYPDCKSISIVEGNLGNPSSAFISLCRRDFEETGYVRCELGKVYASGRSLG
jgi:hypothetical protein